MIRTLATRVGLAARPTLNTPNTRISVVGGIISKRSYYMKSFRSFDTYKSEDILQEDRVQWRADHKDEALEYIKASGAQKGDVIVQIGCTDIMHAIVEQGFDQGIDVVAVQTFYPEDQDLMQFAEYGEVDPLPENPTEEDILKEQDDLEDMDHVKMMAKKLGMVPPHRPDYEEYLELGALAAVPAGYVRTWNFKRLLQDLPKVKAVVYHGTGYVDGMALRHVLQVCDANPTLLVGKGRKLSEDIVHRGYKKVTVKTSDYLKKRGVRVVEMPGDVQAEIPQPSMEN